MAGRGHRGAAGPRVATVWLVCLAVVASVLLGVAVPSRASAQPARRKLYVVSDSVVLGAKSAIESTFSGWDVTLDGVPAIFTETAAGLAAERREHIGDVAIVATGYNYPYWDPARFDRSIDQMMSVLTGAGATTVIWVTLREISPEYVTPAAWRQIQPYYWYFPRVNQHLRDALHRHPQLSLADWDAISHVPGLTYDAIHLDTSGARRMADLLHREVQIATTRQRGTTTQVIDVTRAGVPADAAAVALNLTFTNQRLPGWAVVHPCGSPRPNTSNVNYRTDTTTANAVVTALGPGGTVCLYTVHDSHVIVDVTGWFPKGSPIDVATPTRLLDTRGGPRPTPGTDVRVPIGGVAGRPAAGSAIVNVTAAEPLDTGYVTVHPCGRPADTSTVNVRRGADSAALTTVPLDDSGALCVRSSTSTHLLVDLVATSPGRGPLAVPRRVLDTRRSAGAGAKAERIQVLTVPVAAAAGLPSDTTGVALTVTATDADDAGFVTVWPCGAPIPVASTLNVGSGGTVANAVLTPLGTDRTVCVAASVRTHLLVDVTAVFEPPGFVGATPVRVRDTRIDGPPRAA